MTAAATTPATALDGDTVVVRWFGASFDALHPRLQDLHRHGGVLRGEVTIVVAGAPAPGRVDDPAELIARVRALEDGGTTRKEAIVEVARSAGVPKRVVYDAVHKPAPAEGGGRP